MSLVTQLVVWCDGVALDLEPTVVLHPDTIDRFVIQGCAHLSSGTRLNYQSTLRTVGEAVLGAPLYGRDGLHNGSPNSRRRTREPTRRPSSDADRPPDPAHRTLETREMST